MASAEHTTPPPDLAGYVLGVLEPAEAEDFRRHLESCPTCPRTVEQLRRLPDLLEHAAPAFELPVGLEAQTMAVVERAARAPQPVTTVSHRLDSPARRAVLGMAAMLALAFVAALIGSIFGDRGAQVVNLVGPADEPTLAVARVTSTDVGRAVELQIEHLADPRPEGIYELWFVGEGDTLRSPNRISGGTFYPQEANEGKARLLAGPFARSYPRLEVTLEPNDGDPRRTGPIVLAPQGSQADPSSALR